ncbi:MAG TPA: peptidoglycan DD-metalloendopeptidase family protein [Burkholderiales bacterium]|nr:peptidoglycan DD-metalloendopeptidase family protein [Burkholderiales bacterium]
MPLAALLAAGCASHTPAPVVTRSLGTPPPIAATAKPAPAAGEGGDTYTVKRGDTLYSIALDHGVGYRDLAEWNNLANPNMIRIDQVLRLRPPGEAAPADQGGVQVRPLAEAAAPQSRPLDSRAPESRPLESKPAASAELVKSEPRAVKLRYTPENLALLSQPRPPVPTPVTGLASAPAAASAPVPAPAPQLASIARPEIKPPPVPAPEIKPAPPAAPPPPAASQADDDDDKVDWGWPTAGRVSTPFSDSGNKGMDISGKDGQPVYASASGTVLYVGSGIRGYGKLIVIRHNKAYSTVYAHNSEILVKEGQRVVKGQKVAEMGNTDSDSVKLHFEIRRLGKPVDPAKFLPAT